MVVFCCQRGGSLCLGSLRPVQLGIVGLGKRDGLAGGYGCKSKYWSFSSGSRRLIGQV